MDVKEVKILKTEEPAWQTIHQVVDASCKRESLTEEEAHLVWELGLGAFKAARYWGMETWRGVERRIEIASRKA